MLEGMIGETLNNARLKSGRGPYVRDLVRVVREAVAHAVTVVTDDPAVKEPLSAALMMRLATQLDPMPAALQDPAAVHRWLAPSMSRHGWAGGGIGSTWASTAISVVDAVTAKMLRGITDDARRGGSFECGPGGRSITGQRLVVCAGASL